MNLKYVLLCLLLSTNLLFAQEGIKPYPGAQQQEMEEKVVPPNPFVVAIIQVIGVIIILGVALVMILIFFAVMLFIIKILFFSKKIPEFEILKKERIARCKSWNGSNLGIVRLFGEKKNIQGSIIGYCSGFCAEGEFDYITYHMGLPSYLLVLKLLKGPRFQIHIPIIDITIPRDFIIQLSPDEHSQPGTEIWLYGSGLVNAQSGYEALNTTKINIDERMKLERADLIARAHGETASYVQQLSEIYWESKPESQRGKPPSYKVSSGK